MSDSTHRARRRNSSYSSGETVRLQVPYPEPGTTVEVEFPRYGLTVLVERRERETQEQLRARFVVTAPKAEGDRRTHAARLGTGTLKPKKMGVTLCTEESSDPTLSGTRLTGLTMESVTCGRCLAALKREGVEIAAKEGSGS